MDTPLLKRGGMRVAGLVDADPGTGGGAILRPPAMRRVIGQRAAAAVDGRAEQRARGVPGPGQIEPEQRDVAGGYGGTSDRRYICASGPGSLDIAPLASQLVTLAGNPAGPVPRLQGRMETRHGGGVRRAPRPGFRRGPGEHLADWRGGDQTGQVPAFLDPAKPDRPAMNTSDRGLPRVTAGRRYVPIAGLVYRYPKCRRLAQLRHFVISSLHIPVICQGSLSVL